MKSFRKFLFGMMLLVAAFGTQQASASHVAAADLYWDYIGTGPTNLNIRLHLCLQGL